MNWYYAESGQQVGPVTDEQLGEMVRSGRINDDTLVWHEGMTDWAAYGQVKPASPLSPSGQAPEAAATWPAVQVPTTATCAECGNSFPLTEMIHHGNTYICANCKPIFMQKLSEGLITGVRRGKRSLPVNADQLIAEIETHDYQLDIGSCLSRSWNLLKSNFGLCVGATFLVMLCNQAAGILPFIGVIISLLVQGPLIGGLNNFFIKMVRGEQPGIGDAFSGFSSHFWRLCGTFLLMMLLIYVWFIPVGIYFGAVMRGFDNGTTPLFWILLALGICGMVYIGVAFSFALPLCIDMELGPLDSLRVSRRIVSRHWLTVFGLLVVAGILSMLGLFGCIIGVIATMPILYAAVIYAYEDIFGVEPEH